MGYLYRHQRQNRNEPTKAFPLPRPVTNLLNRSHRYWLPFQSGWSGSHLVTWDIIPSEPQPPSLQHSQHFSLWVSRELQPAEPKGLLSALLTLTLISLLQDQPHICSRKTRALLVLHMADHSARKCWQESRWQREPQIQLLEEILVFLERNSDGSKTLSFFSGVIDTWRLYQKKYSYQYLCSRYLLSSAVENSFHFQFSTQKLSLSCRHWKRLSSIKCQYKQHRE